MKLQYLLLVAAYMASSSVYAAPVGTGADIQLPAKGEPPVKVTVDPTNSAQSAFTETPAGDNGGHLRKRDLLEQAVGKIDIKERAKMCVSVHIGSAEYSKYNCGSFPGAVPAPAGGPPTGPPAAGGAQDTSSILYGTLGTVDVDAKADVCLSLQVGSPEWHKNHCDEKKMLQHSPPNSGGGPGSPTGGNSKTPAVAGIIGNVDAKATVDVCLTLTQGAPEWYSHRCDQKNAPGGGAGAPDHEPAGPSAPGLVQKAVGDVSVVAKAKVCAGLTVGTAAYDANHCGDKDYNPGGGAGNPQTGGTGSLLDKVAGPINGDAKVDVCAKVVVGSAEYKRLGCTPKNDRDVTPGGNQPDDDDGPPSTTPGHDGLVSKTTGGVNVDAKVNVCASIAFGTPAYYQHGCANQVGGNPAPGGGPGTPPGQNPGSGIIDKIVGPGGADVTTDVCAHVTIASPEDVRKKCGFKGPDGPGTPPGGGPGTPPGGGPGTTPGGLIPGVTGPVDVSTNTNVCVGLTVGTPDYIKHNCGSKNPPPGPGGNPSNPPGGNPPGGNPPGGNPPGGNPPGGNPPGGNPPGGNPPGGNPPGGNPPGGNPPGGNPPGGNPPGGNPPGGNPPGGNPPGGNPPGGNPPGGNPPGGNPPGGNPPGGNPPGGNPPGGNPPGGNPPGGNPPGGNPPGGNPPGGNPPGGNPPGGNPPGGNPPGGNPPGGNPPGGNPPGGNPGGNPPVYTPNPGNGGSYVNKPPSYSTRP